MLYSLELERQNRQAAAAPAPVPTRARASRILARAADHPRHAAELLDALALERAGLGEVGEVVYLAGLLHRLAIDHPGEPALRAHARRGLELALEASLDAEDLAFLTPLAARARRLFRGPGGAALLDDHLLAVLNRVVDHAREGHERLYAALLAYAARRVRRPGPLLRDSTGTLLDLHRLLPAFRSPERRRPWYLPTLAALGEALGYPAVRARLRADPAPVLRHLEALWADLAWVVADGDEEVAAALLGHLVTMAEALPDLAPVRDAFAHLPRLLEAASGGPAGRLGRRLTELAGERPRAAGPAPAWSSLEELAGRLTREREQRARVSASLRPRSRRHLAHLLEAQDGMRDRDRTVGALYPATRLFPLPLVVLYFRRGQRDALRESVRGHLDIHLEKLEGIYRMSVVEPNRREALTTRTYIDELSTHAVRRSMVRSGGVYGVALVELETLEVAALKVQRGYLDFTGAYFRGVERVLADDLEGAIREFEKALAANPRLKGVNCHLGLCYRKLARGHLDMERSSACYRRELGLDPESGDALNNLGVLSLAEGNLEDAFDFLERAVDAEPTHLTALTNLAATCLALPRRAGTRERVQDVLQQIYALTGESESLARLAREARDVFDLDVLGELRLRPRT